MIHFSLQTNPQFLSASIDKVVAQALDQEKFEIHGVQVKLAKRGDTFINMDGKVVFVNAIVEVEIFRSNGLFSTEAHGTIDLSMIVSYDITSDYRLTTRTEIVSHKWIDKPKLEVGFLNIPVESLLDLVINHHESIITAKIDKAIQENFNLKEEAVKGIGLLNSQIGKANIYGLQAHLHPRRVILQPPSYSQKQITFNGVLDIELAINTTGSSAVELPVLEWSQGLASGGVLIGDFTIPASTVMNIAMEQMKGQEIGGKPLVVKSANIILKDNLFTLEARISSPIASAVVVNGGISYEEEKQTLHLNNVDVQMEPDSFIYKLTAPLVSRFIEGKVEDMFPMDLAKIIGPQVERFLLPEIKQGPIKLSPSVGKVLISKLSFHDNAIIGKAMIKDPAVKMIVL